jgi:acetyl-CoA acetyltransferase
MSMNEVVIIAALRTPIGKLGDLFGDVSVLDLKRGLAALCAGGGMGTAIVLERE